MYQSFYRGYGAIFSPTGRLLAGETMGLDGVVSGSGFSLATVNAITRANMFKLDFPSLSFGSPVPFYLEKGGRINDVLDALTRNAKDRINDGDIDESYEHDEHWINLVKCANDEKISLVGEKIGLDPRKPWGPYLDGFREDDIDSEDGGSLDFLP